MNFDLRLSHKGLVLVSVPLLFECLFLLVLCFQINDADAAVKRQIRAKQITEQVDSLSSLFLQADISLAGYSTTHSPLFKDRYDAVLLQIPTTLDKIKQLIGSEEQSKNMLAKVDSVAEMGISTLNKAEELLAHSEDQDTAQLNAAQMHSTMRFIADSLNKELLEATLSERQLQERAPELEKEKRFQLLLMIGIAAGSSVLITCLLALYFTRGIGRRLAVLADNSKRFASGKELTEPLSGKDEIAELDSVFREMAVSLNSARQRERAVVDNAMDLICSLDDNGRFRAANPASLKILGYKPEELIANFSYADVVAAEDFERTRKQIRNTIEQKRESEFEMQVKRKDGSLAFTQWSTRWSADEQCLFCVVHDISERIEAEKLRQEVIAMITHDLRSPLTTVSLLLEMLGSEHRDFAFAHNGKMVKAADESAKQMAGLIDDLLDVEKIKAGKMELQIQEIDLQTVLSKAVNVTMGLANRNQVSIELVPTQLRINADADRLARVITNLLSNAAKFSTAGGKIILSSSKVDGYIKISVADQGRGIPVELIGKIFDKFSQVKSSDHSVKGGSGLGLAICKAIIELHGGKIEVQSEIGKGSVFTIFLLAAS